MNCPRCRGHIVSEYARDNEALTHIHQIKCANCGWETDLIMEQNRANQLKGILPELPRNVKHHKPRGNGKYKKPSKYTIETIEHSLNIGANKHLMGV